MPTVHFESVWPVASGNIAAVDIERRAMGAAPGVTKGTAQTFWWSDDGTDDGDPMYAHDPTACPWPMVVMQTPGGFGLLACYGPIHAPGDGGADDLYFWRLEYDSGNALWKHTIYSGGADGDHGVGYLDSPRDGRHFSAIQIGGG